MAIQHGRAYRNAAIIGALAAIVVTSTTPNTGSAVVKNAIYGAITGAAAAYAFIALG